MSRLENAKHKTLSDAMKKFWSSPAGEKLKLEYSSRTGQKSNNWQGGKSIRRPISEATETNVWLGVYIAEKILSEYFDVMIKMPYGNSGYDFICGKGYKIDVKSSCLHHYKNDPPHWSFYPAKNVIADYFLCISFNEDRLNLEPLHIWLIPGYVVNSKHCFSIYNNKKSFDKYSEYEKPLNNVISCCQQMKKEKI